MLHWVSKINQDFVEINQDFFFTKRRKIFTKRRKKKLFLKPIFSVLLLRGKDRDTTEDVPIIVHRFGARIILPNHRLL